MRMEDHRALVTSSLSLSFDGVRHPPADLQLKRLRDELIAGWSIRPESMDYVPEGGGSHHWYAIDNSGRRHFVTVDDLEDKGWLGDTTDDALRGLCSALDTAQTIRRIGLEFVVAPLSAHDGSVARRLGSRYAVSVYPFFAGHSYSFGVYEDEALRDRVIDLIAALHRATPAVRDRALDHVLGYGDRRELRGFLAEPERPWGGGPYSEPARFLFVRHLADINDLVSAFEQLARRTAPAREDTVITHGEPHPANLISVKRALLLVDWDTVALAPRERDLSLIIDTPGSSAERYERATGHGVNFEVMTLYRLRWYLDDLASAVRLFRRPHDENPDTRRWWEGLTPQIEEAPLWLTRLDQ
jgi:spectinomycin phosphotransferase